MEIFFQNDSMEERDKIIIHIYHVAKTLILNKYS